MKQTHLLQQSHRIPSHFCLKWHSGYVWYYTNTVSLIGIGAGLLTILGVGSLTLALRRGRKDAAKRAVIAGELKSAIQELHALKSEYQRLKQDLGQ